MKKLLFAVIVLSLAIPMASLFAAGSSESAGAGSQEIAVIVKTGNSGFWQNVQT